MNDEIRAARNLLNLMNPIYLDTETTGLDGSAEICSIAILDDAGHALLDTLVRPVGSIPDDATRINGLTDAYVVNAPDWIAVWDQVREIVRGRMVVIYNAAYDGRLVQQSGAARGISTHLGEWCETFCAMTLYANFVGEWDSYHGNYRWQKLENACRQMRIDTSDLTPHAALSDCEMTRRLMHALAERAEVTA